MKNFKQLYKTLRHATTLLAAALSAIINPLRIIVTSTWKVLNSLAQTVAETPANAAAAFSEHLSQKAEQFSEKLEEIDAEKNQKKLEQDSAAILRMLFNAGGLWENKMFTLGLKVVLILMLQYASLRTTYRGLAQWASDPVFPILLTFVIQLGVVGLSIIIGYRSTQKSKWVLVLMFLSASIFCSFAGLAERTLHYQSYLENTYEEYVNQYRAVKEDIDATPQAVHDPLAVIEGEYALIDLLLEEGNSLFGDDAMNAAQRNVELYSNKTIAQIVSMGTSVRILPDGKAVMVNNGEKTVAIPDPEAAVPLAEAIAKVDDIKTQQSRMALIRSLLAGDYALDHVKEIVSLQMSSDTSIPEFVSFSTSISTLTASCNQLAQAVGSDIQVSLDLNNLMAQYRDALISAQIYSVQSFDALQAQWYAENNSLPLANMDWLDHVLGTDTAHVPGRLKEIVDQEVSNSFHALSLSLSLLHDEAGMERLEVAFESYHVQENFEYATTALLSPNSELFGGALLALVIALFTDVGALALGLVMVNRSLDLTGTGAIPPAKLRKHMYESLLNVVMPILRARLDRASPPLTREELPQASMKIIADFLDDFDLCPQLARAGFVRYLKGKPDREFFGLYALLLNLGMIEHLNHTDAVAIGLISSDATDEGEDYLILTSRGEAWLMEVLGTPDLFAVSRTMA